MIELAKIELEQIDYLPVDQVLSSIEHVHSDLYTDLSEIFDSELRRYFNPEAVNAYKALVAEAYNSLVDDEESQALQRLYEVLFLHQGDPDTEAFKEAHQELYQPMSVELAEEIDRNPGKTSIIRSGMYGGKTTLAFLTIDRLVEERGCYESNYLVFDGLGDSTITARSVEHNPERVAQAIGRDNYEDVVSAIISQHKEGTRRVVFFDEFSFEDPEIVLKITTSLNEVGIDVILAGLDMDYLGRSISCFIHPSFSPELDEEQRPDQFIRWQCYSYVPGFNEPPDQALGTHTLRYLFINGYWVLDCGLGSPIISKKHPFARYVAALPGQNAQVLLENQPGILESILRPGSASICMQVALRDGLDIQEKRPVKRYDST